MSYIYLKFVVGRLRNCAFSPTFVVASPRYTLAFPFFRLKINALMRSIVSTFLFLLSSCALSAQITLNDSYLPQIGDTLFISFADSLATVDLIGVGGPHNWDFSQLSAVGSAERVVEALDLNTEDAIFATADFKIQVTPFSTNYYQRTGNVLNLIGNRGQTAFIPNFSLDTPFNPPYLDRKAPLSLFDQEQSTSNILVAFAVDSLPQAILDIGGAILNSFDSLRFNTVINRNDLVDAHGTLTVDGVSYPVLRERRAEERMVRIEAKLGFLPWADITALIVSGVPQIGELINAENSIVTYQFWSNDNVEPIATVVTEGDGTTIRDINFKTNRLPSSVQDDFLLASQIKMYPNPAQSTVTFEAQGLQRGAYTLQLNNVLGRQVLRQQIESSGELNTQLDISHLPSGIYLYSLVNSRGRILATKRLLVGGIRP